MAKSKRTIVWFYSEETWNLVHVTTINKKNFKPWEKLSLRKYNKITRKHEVLKLKEIKKGS